MRIVLYAYIRAFSQFARFVPLCNIKLRHVPPPPSPPPPKVVLFQPRAIPGLPSDGQPRSSLSRPYTSGTCQIGLLFDCKGCAAWTLKSGVGRGAICTHVNVAMAAGLGCSDSPQWSMPDTYRAAEISTLPYEATVTCQVCLVVCWMIKPPQVGAQARNL